MKPTLVIGSNGGPNATRRFPASPYDPLLRRRNLRLAVILSVVAVCFLFSSYVFVRRGWIEPVPVTWRFPWSKAAWKTPF